MSKTSEFEEYGRRRLRQSPLSVNNKIQLPSPEDLLGFTGVKLKPEAPTCLNGGTYLLEPFIYSDATSQPKPDSQRTSTADQKRPDGESHTS